MLLDADACYRALRTRDARFDGRFFTGVRSTGVFCRPVCPARTPRPENCVFLPCAAAALEEGFRPCLRCRPEASPGTPAWLGTSATVSRALRLIESGALDDASVERLAERVGVGDRHLRRLFLRHLGATPVAVAQTQRILSAKKLIDETGLPMTQVSAAAGFSSLRRFNDAIRRSYGRPPRELRRAARGGRSAAGSVITLELPYRPPLDWSAMLGFLALRATPGVEQVAGQSYRRSVRIGEATGLVEVEPAADGRHHLVARLALSDPSGLILAAQRLRRLFDLGADPAEIAAHLGRKPPLRALVRARPGLRVPGAWDGFELAVRAILGQQVSVRGATTLAARLVDRHGDRLTETPDLPWAAGLERLFPRPEVLAEADLTEIGLPRVRAAAISALAQGVVEGALHLDPAADPEKTTARLRALPGVGAWTTEYVAMRALASPDAFPASDLGLRRALTPPKTRPPRPREIEARAEAWRPWRAYAALHLWNAQVAP